MWHLQRQRVAWPPRRRRRIPFVTDRGEQRGLGSGQVAGAPLPLEQALRWPRRARCQLVVQGAVDDDRLQFWQFLVTIALLSVAGPSVVTVVLRVRIDRVATSRRIQRRHLRRGRSHPPRRRDLLLLT